MENEDQKKVGRIDELIDKWAGDLRGMRSRPKPPSLRDRQAIETAQAETDDHQLDAVDRPTIVTARFRISDVVLPASTEVDLQGALSKVRYHGLIYETWGFKEVDPSGGGCVVNFYGPPGTGKSRAAEAIAGELEMPFLKVDLAELESKFMGETAKNLKAIFDEANAAEAVLFFDEADTVLGKRLSAVTQGVDAEINLTRSTMLIEMDRFSGVLIFATNFPEAFDSAFTRRISHHVHFDLPDFDARKKIWDMHLVSGLPLETIDRGELLGSLAKKSEGLSGGYILQAMRIALPLAVCVEDVGSSILTQSHILHAIEKVISAKANVGTDVSARLSQTREMFGI